MVVPSDRVERARVSFAPSRSGSNVGLLASSCDGSTLFCMRGVLMLATALAGLVDGCSNGSNCDAVGVISGGGANFTLTCGGSDLTQVVVTGPCTGGPTSGLELPVYTMDGPYVTVYSPTPGVCHVELTFATGFIYSVDVTYTWQGGECGNRYAGPTVKAFTVNNPSDTCFDGGHE